MPTHTASCQCKALTTKFDDEPDFVIACNCRACQKRTGSPFGSGAYFRKDTMTVSGETKTWARAADSGREVVNYFCPACGTNLYWTLEMRPDYIGVAYGSFDTKLPDPVRAIWTEEQVDWVHFPEELPTYPKGTPGT